MHTHLYHIHVYRTPLTILLPHKPTAYLPEHKAPHWPLAGVVEVSQKYQVQHRSMVSLPLVAGDKVVVKGVIRRRLSRHLLMPTLLPLPHARDQVEYYATLYKLLYHAIVHITTTIIIHINPCGNLCVYIYLISYDTGRPPIASPPPLSQATAIIGGSSTRFTANQKKRGVVAGRADLDSFSVYSDTTNSNA